MPADNSRPPSSGAPGEPRPPAERIIVWGGILLLLGLVGIEYSARAGYDKAIRELSRKVQAVDADETGNVNVTESDVKATLRGKNAAATEDLSGMDISNTARRLDTYRWFSLNPFAARKLLIYYGYGQDKNNENPDVLEVSTELVPTAAEKYPRLSHNGSWGSGPTERRPIQLTNEAPPDAIGPLSQETAESGRAQADGASLEEVTQLLSELRAKQAADRTKADGEGAAKAPAETARPNKD